MRIIPVIDLRDGRAVRGPAGERAHYLPVKSRLLGTAASDLSDPVALLEAYRDRLRARTIYVADLDRIEG
ncbi:MAG TPA: HisA/HisF-related TIM barrel protein, partial [Candidatus Polarisedimenticolia bacterium]|nr:HisA/HisF-related TIM barrel protein [Candidatus Polarisedimenticolia bacterium]